MPTPKPPCIRQSFAARRSSWSDPAARPRCSHASLIAARSALATGSHKRPPPKAGRYRRVARAEPRRARRARASSPATAPSSARAQTSLQRLRHGPRPVVATTGVLGCPANVRSTMPFSSSASAPSTPTRTPPTVPRVRAERLLPPERAQSLAHFAPNCCHWPPTSLLSLEVPLKRPTSDLSTQVHADIHRGLVCGSALGSVARHLGGTNGWPCIGENPARKQSTCAPGSRFASTILPLGRK